MNMGVPETPLSPLDKAVSDDVFIGDRHPDIVVTGQDIPINQFRGIKRRREEVERASTKQARVSRAARRRIRPTYSEEPPSHKSVRVHLAKNGTDIDQLEQSCSHAASDMPCDNDSTSSPLFASEHSVAPGLRHTDLRELLRYVINDSLKVGGRPDSAIAEETDFGERIEVRTRSSSGQPNTKMIEWLVTPDVPEKILIDEKDLAKIVSCVALNAIKFTENGDIELKATLSPTKRYIVINFKDTGSGIPTAFRPNLFKPFCREDDSITRQSEGLGLGLMVARGLARKLGGDLYCVYSSVDGPRKGSEFEMRIPCTPGEVCSRPSSPFGSPAPSVKSRLSADTNIRPYTGAIEPITPPLTFDLSKNDEISAEGDNLSLVAKPSNLAPSLAYLELPSSKRIASLARPRASSKGRTLSDAHFDRKLAVKYPLNVLVVEDNKINRKLLVSMLQKLGYSNIAEAYDGNDAVEQMRKERSASEQIDVVLMDLWMPLLDGFQATEAILKMKLAHSPTILAVSADITDAAMQRAAKAGMKGFLTKPFQIRDLQKLIVQYCATLHGTNGPSL
jgi:CheY-like chemotaxis protein